MIGISQATLAIGRIKGAGNCLFRSIAQTLTGSQEDHDEIRSHSDPTSEGGGDFKGADSVQEFEEAGELEAGTSLHLPLHHCRREPRSEETAAAGAEGEGFPGLKGSRGKWVSV